jgi:hypothetical protein
MALIVGLVEQIEERGNGLPCSSHSSSVFSRSQRSYKRRYSARLSREGVLLSSVMLRTFLGRSKEDSFIGGIPQLIQS